MPQEYLDRGEEQLRGQHCNPNQGGAAGDNRSSVAASPSTSLGLSVRVKKCQKDFPCLVGRCGKVYRNAHYLAQHQLNRECHFLLILHIAILIPIHYLLSHEPVRLMLLLEHRR